MFWYLLNRAGLLDEVESDLRSDESLRHIYDTKFLPKYALNFVNLVDRPTIDVTKLTRGEEQAGIKRALNAIRTYKPKVVCFIGKIALNKFQGSRTCDYGWQKDIENVRVYLMHFPIRGPASIRVRELREVKQASQLIRPTVHHREDPLGAGRTRESVTRGAKNLCSHRRKGSR
jgi:G:T/U-mismatch repair DNA glycosylase